MKTRTELSTTPDSGVLFDEDAFSALIGKVVGFTGTQKGMTPEQEQELTSWLLRLSPVEARHGDCVGADMQFHQLVRRLLPDTRIVLHPPTKSDKRAFCKADEEKTPRAYLTRNRAIVRASDVLLAAPAERVEKLRSGTWSTARFARGRGCPLYLLLPDETDKGPLK